MTFETVFVATLLVAHLTVEFQLLKALGFHAVGNVFGGSLFGFWHGGNLLQNEKEEKVKKKRGGRERFLEGKLTPRPQICCDLLCKRYGTLTLKAMPS